MFAVIRTIYRNFLRRPVTNIINISGLSVSLTLVIILSIYSYSELTTDNFHKNGDRVYIYGLESDHVYTPGILKDNIDQKVPGVESCVRISGTWEAPVFQADNKEAITSDMIFADEGFFRLFTYKFIEGSEASALKEPMTIVITNTLSHKLFGQTPAIGRTITINNGKNLTVSAVIEEPAANSCLSFSSVTNIPTRKIIQENGGEYTEWGWCDFQTFLLLKNKVDPDETAKTILSLFPEEIRKDYVKTSLTPLEKIYFSKFTLYGSNYIVSADKKKVQILVLVASLVLVIALVNFVNISTSQWQEKIKQTGITKVIGATRANVLFTILAESFLFFLVSLFIAAELVNIVNPLISGYTGIHYNERLTHSPGFIIVSLSAILTLSVTFSIIPALRISSSAAIDNLKKTVSSNKTNYSSRGILVTMQFAIAIVLVAFTFLVQKQVRYGSSNLGFRQNNILSVRLTEQLNQKKDVLRNQISGYPNVKRISFSQFHPGKLNQSRETQLTQNGEKKQISFDLLSADAELFEMLGLELVSGRFFSDSISSDRKKIVVNEAFLRENRLTDPLGATVALGRADQEGYNSEIIGVVKDFHFKPLTQPIVALAIRNDTYNSYCLAEIQANDFTELRATVEDLRKTVSELSPAFPVEISFLDQAVHNMYESELRFRRTFSLFALCALVICSLGILAMSIFACQRRVKEIGIRKVNGARIIEIFLLLNKDFIKWVGFAFIIATPVAWFVMNKWLEGFAYRTELSWWIFLSAGLFALGIALLTVSWHSWRTATRNPVEALRYE